MKNKDIHIKVTEGQHNEITDLAEINGCTITEIILGALKDSGYIANIKEV